MIEFMNDDEFDLDIRVSDPGVSNIPNPPQMAGCSGDIADGINGAVGLSTCWTCDTCATCNFTCGGVTGKPCAC